MFYVVRQGEPLEKYHATYADAGSAKEYAEGLKKTFGHQYNVIKVETVWTTQTLAELKAEGAF